MNNNEITLSPIGRVQNDYETHEDLHKVKTTESVIEIFDEYTEGLFRIEESKYLQILFNFDRVDSYFLKGPTFDGEVRGVFASRSPRRPSGIGMTTVELIERNGSFLKVHGLDALNGSPIIDIKPYAKILDEEKQDAQEMQYLKSTPRTRIHSLIRKNDREALLVNAGTIHGHYCPGLSLGVSAATELMRKIGKTTDGLEDIVAVIETNNCFSDGIQYVTGCTFGNNSLIYRDMGKTACSLVNREGNGIRASVLPTYRGVLEKEFPEYFMLFDKVVCNNVRDADTVASFKKEGMEASFAMAQMDPSSLISFSSVSLELPRYAPIFDTYVCTECNEGIMSTRAVGTKESALCLSCSSSKFSELNGFGITQTDKHLK